MGSASQRSVQDLYGDVGDHYRIFIRAPFFQLLKHRDYWVPLLYFFFVLITLFWDLYYHSGQYLYEARSLLPFYLFPFLIAALRIGDIVVDTRCRNVENLGGFERSVESSRYVQLSLYERQWFRLRYRAYGGNLRCLAGDLVENWRLWKEVNSKAAKDIDGAVMLRFFLPPRDLARLVTLLAALIAVIATLIITLGADRQGYFEFVDNLPAYLKLYWGVVFIVAFSGPYVIFLGMQARLVLRAMIDALSISQPSDKLFYQFIQRLIWADGVKPANPSANSRVLRAVDSMVDFFYEEWRSAIGKLVLWLVALLVLLLCTLLHCLLRVFSSARTLGEALMRILLAVQGGVCRIVAAIQRLNLAVPFHWTFFVLTGTGALFATLCGQP